MVSFQPQKQVSQVTGFKSADNTLITSAVDQISLLEAGKQLNNILNNKIQQDKREQE